MLAVRSLLSDKKNSHRNPTILQSLRVIPVKLFFRYNTTYQPS